jgi:Lipocalin-like domain
MVNAFYIKRGKIMKKGNLILILMGLSMFASFVYADSAFKTSEEVEGTWKLEYTKKSMTASETIKREDTWTFNKDGKVTISHIPRDGTFFDQSPVNYKIEDGKLKISVLGRSGKFEVFSLVEKDANNMTLKNKYGDIYQFKK